MRSLIFALLSVSLIYAATATKGCANDVSLSAEVASSEDKGQPIGLIHLTLRNLSKDRTYIFNGVGNYGFGARVFCVSPNGKKTLLWSPPYPPQNQPIEQNLGIPMKLSPGDVKEATLQLGPVEINKAKDNAVICVVVIQNQNLSPHSEVQSSPKVFWK